MFKGTVKWFCPEQGFGIITNDKVEQNVFVHFTAIISAGLISLAEGQRVNFDLEYDQKNNSKVKAVNVSVA